MANTVVRVYTPAGRLVGKFLDPAVDMDPEHNYEIKGIFVDDDGKEIEKLEINPQVLPYTLDIAQVNKCSHTTIQGGYVQRGRQPVVITAACKL